MSNPAFNVIKKISFSLKLLAEKVRSRTFIKILSIILALIPPLILIISVLKFAVNVPFWDEWNFVPLIGKSFEEGITLEDLWTPHNEHRLLFPRLILLLTAHLADYNVIYEMMFNIFLAACLFLIIAFQFKKTLNKEKEIYFWLFIPILSLFIFSLNQGINWVMGCQVQIFINLLAVVTGFFLLAGIPLKRIHFLGALLAGLVATYSLASGLLFWLIGVFALLINTYKSRKEKILYLSIWTITTLFVYQNYFYNFYRDPALSPILSFLKSPLEYVKYIFKFLGAAIINYEEYALVIGLLGFLFFVYMNLHFLKNGIDYYRRILPFVLVGLYAIGTGMVTGIGRVAMGSEQAMAHRYVTISGLFWISNICGAFLYIKIKDKKRRKKPKILSAKPVMFVILMILVLLVVRTSYRVGYSVLKKHHEMLVPAKKELITGQDDEILKRLYIDTKYIKYGVRILKKYNLSVFSEEESP